MLSQNVAKSTVPSYYMIRTNLPHRKPLNQWEGVYYFSGITKRQQHVLLLQRKRMQKAYMQRFNESRALLSQKLAERPWIHQIEPHEKQLFLPKEGETVSKHAQEAFALACMLARHGMYIEASQCVESLHYSRQLTVEQYVVLLNCLAADILHERVLHTDATCDPVLTFKFMGDEAGDARASEAYRWYEWGMDWLREDFYRRGGEDAKARKTAVASQLMNALMRVSLTCGYQHVVAVSDTLYDQIGVQGIHPTMSTYEMVVLSLALQGRNVEAEDILRYVRHNHSDQMTINIYNALLIGHREAHAFDRCDELWQELVDRRWPRANALTAEIYLRSIVDHSYTPVSEPLQRFGNINVVEKKKIPIVLVQLDELGIPRTHLSRPLLDEVEDALRKFSIYKNRFYEWGRAVKQFDFIEFRRRHGWMYDLHLMKRVTRHAPPVRDPTQPDATMAPAATVELPAFFTERFSWESQPLEDVLFVTETKERTGDVRSGDIYEDQVRSVHERSPNWMTQVPETRYDQLYGITHPDVAKIGIRRHLDVEYINRKEVMERDAALVRKSVSSGRRLRHRVENVPTHRKEGSLIKKAK